MIFICIFLCTYLTKQSPECQPSPPPKPRTTRPFFHQPKLCLGLNWSRERQNLYNWYAFKISSVITPGFGSCLKKALFRSLYKDLKTENNHSGDFLEIITIILFLFRKNLIKFLNLCLLKQTLLQSWSENFRYFLIPIQR